MKPFPAADDGRYSSNKVKLNNGENPLNDLNESNLSFSLSGEFEWEISFMAALVQVTKFKSLPFLILLLLLLMLFKLV